VPSLDKKRTPHVHFEGLLRSGPSSGGAKNEIIWEEMPLLEKNSLTTCN
jgi:hypothetical protein